MSALDMWHLFAAAQRRSFEQWSSPRHLTEVRTRRLRRLASIAAHTSYYRSMFERANIVPAELTEASLERMPVLEKMVLRSPEAGQMLANPAAKLFPVNTSGSTGVPLQVLRNQRDQAEVSAVWARIFGAYGRRTWDRQVNIGSGRAVAKKGPVVRLRELGILPQLHQLASFDPPERQIALLRSVKPHMISAYAVGLELLAEAVLESGATDIRPRILYTSGMALTPRCRELARKAFGIEPFDVYAANEVGPIGWECPHHRGALHLNDDTQITEIVDDDGHRVPDGTSGQVVVTQLLCTAQPLIRYRIGDISSLRSEPCECGRGLRLMEPVEGRTQHTIRSPDGRVINTITVSSILSTVAEIRRYQVRQTAPRDLRVLVVPSSSWKDGSEAAVRARFVERLGDAFEYEIVAVNDLPLTPGGKFQTIVPLDQATARFT
jgi:phenylacetate-coenzyme A ligase PaaK-like adenylate-forming protein